MWIYGQLYRSRLNLKLDISKITFRSILVCTVIRINFFKPLENG